MRSMPSVDLASGRVTMTGGGATVTATWVKHPQSISYVGAAAINAAVV